jgi:L-ascorbate metabolism protein UlaG (beta-lactamase superfamily)
MSTKSLTLALVVIVLSGTALAAQTDVISVAGGEIRITPITHGSVRLECGDTVVYVDPWSRGDYSGSPPADLILVTDIHGDHLDPEMIARLRQEGTAMVIPAAAADQVEGATVLGNGETVELADIGIEAVPMYNLVRGPEEGKLFHDKGRGNGYILTVGGQRVYFAGDTECTPEMRALEGIDIAFVPMNLPYTMPPEEAAECVRSFRPRIVYPYHYRGSDLEIFRAVLESEPEIEVRVRDWYPGS